MPNDRVFAMSFAGVYPHYVAKAEKMGRTKGEVDEIIRWLTGYTKAGVRTGSGSDWAPERGDETRSGSMN